MIGKEVASAATRLRLFSRYSRRGNVPLALEAIQLTPFFNKGASILVRVHLYSGRPAICHHSALHTLAYKAKTGTVPRVSRTLPQPSLVQICPPRRGAIGSQIIKGLSAAQQQSWWHWGKAVALTWYFQACLKIHISSRAAVTPPRVLLIESEGLAIRQPRCH